MAKKKLSDQQVKLIAESLLPSFVPKNPEEADLRFNFTAEGCHFQVNFKKDGKAWNFISYQEQIEQ